MANNFHPMLPGSLKFTGFIIQSIKVEDTASSESFRLPPGKESGGGGGGGSSDQLCNAGPKFPIIIENRHSCV